jgi:hypothetical protein
LPQQSPAGQNTPAPNTFLAYALTIGAVAVLLILAVLMFGVVIRRRRKKTPGATSKPIGDRGAQRPPVATMQQQRPGPPNGVPPYQAAGFDQSMAAFGAPVPGTTLPQTGAPPSVLSGTLRPWPCGHMNRSNARYCSICGEPAPPPPTQRRVEQ